MPIRGTLPVIDTIVFLIRLRISDLSDFPICLIKKQKSRISSNHQASAFPGNHRAHALTDIPSLLRSNLRIETNDPMPFNINVY